MVSVITMQSVWYSRQFWVLLQAMFTNDENKRHGKAIKIERETTNNQKKKYNLVKHLQRQQFLFTKTSIKVSLKILEPLSVKLTPASRRGVYCFRRWTPRGKKIAQSFLSTAKFMTKYSSERFLSICGELIYLKAF